MAGPNLHLDSNVGCLFIGTLFSLIFFGCTVAQTTFYYSNYPDDRLALKTLVAFLTILDVATLTLDIEYVWVLAVQNHANPAAIEILPRSWIAEFFLASMTFFIVQLFFIHKIWTLLSGRPYRLLLSLSVGLLSFLSFAGGVGVCSVAAINQSFLFILPHEKVPGTVQQIASVLTDIYITISLCIILRRSQATFKQTQTLLSKLSTYAINRGMLSATIQLLHYATYVATYHSTSFIWMIFHIPGSKVYVNSLLAMLNVRHNLRDVHSSPALDGASSIQFIVPEDLDNQIVERLP
ncbi:hypothetical protein OBBRIDRAFT_791700 [Obba rivulosa]|uniref:DUF6534 domain-containing protein n=1 Tax=Obba rivulosa TaxID=1052685 RepID=A0A8E2DNY3_9APHY|nr:hypothetical protein OBBRIDRAFT_791700 [Obba rivulosa]